MSTMTSSEAIDFLGVIIPISTSVFDVGKPLGSDGSWNIRGFFFFITITLILQILHRFEEILYPALVILKLFVHEIEEKISGLRNFNFIINYDMDFYSL